MTGRKARYIPYATADDFPTNGVHFLEQIRDMFKFVHSRDGEYYSTGITELRSAAELKHAAFIAKGGKGREKLMSVEEWFKVKFVN